MIVVKLSGGLGNQMFQYSLAVLLRQMGKDVEIDLSSFQYVNEHCGPELLSVFNVEQSERLKHSFESFQRRERIIEKYSHFKLKHSLLPLPSSWKLKHLWRFDSPKYKLKSVNLNEIIFDAKEIRDLDNCVLDGWAHPSCNSSTELELRKQFQFMHIPDRIFPIISMIESTNSVGVHIRRGDFLPSKNRTGSIALLDNYYNDSIKIMESILGGGDKSICFF